jgi:hypothetical protein
LKLVIVFCSSANLRDARYLLLKIDISHMGQD